MGEIIGNNSLGFKISIKKCKSNTLEEKSAIENLLVEEIYIT